LGSYEVIIYKPAKRYLERCGRVLGRRLAARLDALGRDPYAHGKPLAGVGPLRSARVGDLRIIYEVEEPGKRVHVYAIGPRGQIYRNLRK